MECLGVLPHGLRPRADFNDLTQWSHLMVSLRELALKKWTMVLALGLPLIGGGLVFKYCWHQAAPPRFETAMAQRGAVVARITSTGTLSALVTVQVGAQVSGRIQRIFVDFNSAVKKGQPVAQIDPQLLEASAQQARANWMAAKGNLMKAQALLQDAERARGRMAALLADKMVSQADLDTAQTNLLSAQAQIEVARGGVAQAQAALHQAQVNLSYTHIVSPINGVVISRNVDVGQTVASALQSPTLFTIAEDLHKMQVDANIAEADIGKLKAGMRATFTVDAYPGERFEGRIREIRNAAQTVQNVVTYDTVIDVENSELKLKPGMTANVTIIYAEKESVLRVPSAALRFRPPADHPLFALPTVGAPAQGSQGKRRSEGQARARSVWRLKEGKTPELLHLTLGLSDGAMTEVLESKPTPLNEGDVLITDVTIESTGAATKPALPGVSQPAGMRRLF